jgi:putative flippase GtrA
MRRRLHELAGNRMCRFLIVGSGAAALLLALTYALARLGMPPFAGSVTAYAVAFCCAYLAQRGWTFGGNHDHSRALPRYFVLQAGCAAFSGLVSHVAVSRLGMAPLPMAVVTTVAASAASYVVSSAWVFPMRHGKQ